MTKPKTQIGNEVRAMTDAEFAQYQLDQIETEAQTQAIAARAEAKQAVLDRLGLTAEEAALLLS
jgi:hypothetical protein